MMNLPKQVQEQAEQAERLMQSIVGDSENTEIEAPAEQPTPTTEPEPQPEPEPEVEPQPEPQPEPETPETPASDEIDWQARALKAEQKYSVLQGKYNAEIAELKNNDQSGEIQQLHQTIRDLQTTITELKQQPEPAPADDPVASQLEQLREDYGSELVDGLLAAAKQQVMGEVSGQVQQVQQNVQQDSFSTKKAVLAQKLAGQRINFEQVNNDPLFHQWLSKYDPETGIQRQAALSQTFEAGQLDATAKLFIEYVQGDSQTTPQPTQTPFEQHVQKTTSAPAQEAAPTPVPSFTNQQIAQFYDDWARGKISEEQARRTEEQIMQFTTQGAR